MAKNRRDRLIEQINADIQRRKNQQLPLFGSPKPLNRLQLIEIALSAAEKLSVSGKSDRASFLAEILTLPQLSGKGISFISQNAVTGGKRYRGVAEHLRELEKAGVDPAIVVKTLLTSKADIRTVIQKLPLPRKRPKKIENELGVILFWHNRRMQGHASMQSFADSLTAKKEEFMVPKLTGLFLETM